MGRLPFNTTPSEAGHVEKHNGPITNPNQLVGEIHAPHSKGKSFEDKVAGERDIRAQILESWVKFAGLVDSEALYKLILRWFEEREFEVWEQMYKHKPPEVEIRWEALKKIDTFRMDRVNLHLHFYDLKEVTVEQEGVKRKMWNCRLRVWTWFEIVTDYPDMFGDRKFNSTFEKKLLRFLNKYVLRRDIELRELDRLYYELWGLHAQIKSFLGMEARGNAY